MDFLRVYPKGMTLEQMRLSNGLCILKEAKGVNITDEINSTSTLTFSLPRSSDKWHHMKQGNLILYEGRIFSIYLKERQKEQAIYRTVTAYSLISKASEKLILIFPVMIAKTPKEIMTEAFKDTNFEILDILPNDMEWVTTPTDFVEAQSKLTPLEVAEQLIDKIGEGELYCDNYQIALVKKIVTNRAVINATPKFNLKAVSDSEDGTGIITRLYPFGKDDLTLAGDTPYIDSPLQSVYGIREGYIDYKDITSQEELLEKAEWEFSEDNPQRIDMPSLFYTLSLADVWKIYGEKYKVGLGDTIKITDVALELETFQRIIKITFYPHSPENSTVTLGTPPKTIKSVIQSLAKTEEKYNKTLDENGNIKTEWLSNLIRNQSEYITDLLLANEVVKHKIGDLWTFENPAGDKAIAIVDGQLAISDKKNADGTWNWTTFINGKSVSASVLNSGTLNTNLIEVKSQSGKTSLSGDSFKMVAEDGTTVSIRSTDGEDGTKKGMQIIENYDEKGNPLNYSIYDSAGYRRYINGSRVQTYSVMWSGTHVTSFGYAGDPATTLVECSGDYFYNWALKYNDPSTTDAQRKQMLNILLTFKTPVPDMNSAYITEQRYEFSGVAAIKGGVEVKFGYNNRGSYTPKENGAALFFSSIYYYKYLLFVSDSGSGWGSDKKAPAEADILLVTTMDV